MISQELESRARELYAAECERGGGQETARIIRLGRTDWSAERAIRVIASLLNQIEESATPMENRNA